MEWATDSPSPLHGQHGPFLGQRVVNPVKIAKGERDRPKKSKKTGKARRGPGGKFQHALPEGAFYTHLFDPDGGDGDPT